MRDTEWYQCRFKGLIAWLLAPHGTHQWCTYKAEGGDESMPSRLWEVARAKQVILLFDRESSSRVEFFNAELTLGGKIEKWNDFKGLGFRHHDK